MEKVLAFDLEIVKDIPQGDDWKTIRPLGISCAAACDNNSEDVLLWYHGWLDKTPIEGAMTKEELEPMLNYFKFRSGEGYKVLTWNGLQFDFDVLAEESGNYETCKQLALEHIDMMFQIFCLKGYPLGLNTVAHGLGLSGKTEGMHGDLAPQMWANSEEDRWKVLEYVKQGAITTWEVFLESSKRKSINWISRSGKYQYMTIPEWKSVSECLKYPEPDTSWMSSPMKRESFLEWTNGI
jgi:hypothetical protein